MCDSKNVRVLPATMYTVEPQYQFEISSPPISAVLLRVRLYYIPKQYRSMQNVGNHFRRGILPLEMVLLPSLKIIMTSIETIVPNFSSISWKRQLPLKIQKCWFNLSEIQFWKIPSYIHKFFFCLYQHTNNCLLINTSLKCTQHKQ